MVCDEVMAGFGRTGRWFGVDHWDVVPDLMTMAKGLTSSYVQLGAVAMRHEIAEPFEDEVFYGGLTYSSHPARLATALATIEVYEDDDLIGNAQRMGRSCRPITTASRRSTRPWARRATSGCSGSSTWSAAGIRGRRSRRTTAPRTRWRRSASSSASNASTRSRRTTHPHEPAAVITEDQLAEGFDIIDRALDIADQAVTG